MGTTEFRGFSPAAIDFYRGLLADNSRAYWTAHREVWERDVRGAMERLTDAVRDEFGELHVFRPNRDVRFSKDKTPYKTHCGAVTEGAGGESYYLHVSAEGLFVASGYYQMASDQLDRYRRAVADDTTGDELEAVLVALRRRYEIGGEALKTAPRGFARDHPRVTLLRHKGLTMARSFPPAAWLGTPKALERITGVWRDAAAMNAWLNRHVGPSTLPPERW